MVQPGRHADRDRRACRGEPVVAGRRQRPRPERRAGLGHVLHLSGSAATVPASVTVPVSATTTSAAYVVQPGDTLTAIAARAGVSPSSLAAANGLDPNGVLVSGKVLHLAGSPALGGVHGGHVAAGRSRRRGIADRPAVPDARARHRVRRSARSPRPTASRASLAEAIGWQESGFNNDLVSSADARGVMQILPGHLALDPAVARLRARRWRRPRRPTTCAAAC